MSKLGNPENLYHMQKIDAGKIPIYIYQNKILYSYIEIIISKPKSLHVIDIYWKISTKLGKYLRNSENNLISQKLKVFKHSKNW